MTVPAEVAFFTERLAHKEQELNEVQAAFNKYKLKHKCKLDQLKKDVNAYCTQNGIPVEETENSALLLIRLTETELALEESRNQAEQLHLELSRRQIILNDHVILTKNLEEQIKSMSPIRESELEERKQNSKHIDLDGIQQQMMYKDERIVELNNVILDKERQILDLQEMCREQGEVADVKSQAMRIVQRKFEEMETRGRREVGTETDSSLWHRGRERDIPLKTAARSSSPGHAVANRSSTGAGSPPPLDPSEAEERFGTSRDYEDELPGTSYRGDNLDSDALLRKKQRKKVTFDLPPSAAAPLGQPEQRNEVTESLKSDLLRVSEENAELRRRVEEQTLNMNMYEQRLTESDSNVARLLKESKNTTLKARAVAQGRIRDLEDRMADLNNQNSKQLDRLQTEIETLRSTREWEIEQNGQLREQLTHLREKTHKLTEELDASEKANRSLDSKVTETQSLLDQLIEELSEAESIVVFMEDQKHSILDDVDRLKDALLAQDELIDLLEADVVIYEEHIGILRESLGASKVDHRSLIRSKAFETKLKALEQEKEQINRKSNEDRLRTKALSQKVKILEDENEKLMERLCEKEMGAQDEADMVDTCRQLELRIKEAEDRMLTERAEMEMRIETARLEGERKAREAEGLLYELQEARALLDNSRRHDAGQLAAAVQQQPPPGPNEMDTASHAAVDQLNTLVTEKTEELERCQELIRSLNEQIDGLQGHNFELQGELQNLKQTEEDFDNLVERHRTTSISVVNLSEENASLKTELAELKVEVESLRQSSEESAELRTQHETETTALRTELEHARINLRETNAVKLELDQLRAELEHERTSGQEKWEEVCRRMLEGESSNPASRKSSMEVQNQQYIIAFEEKIEKLEEELADANAKIEEQKVEKRKLKSAVKQLRDRAAVAPAPVPAVAAVEEMTQPMVEREEQEKQGSSEGTKQESDSSPETLEKRIKDLELECMLSGELNVEMGRAMLEMEQEMERNAHLVETATTSKDQVAMELRLHEMLQEEMGREMDELKEANTALLNRITELEEQSSVKTAAVEQLEVEMRTLRAVEQVSEADSSDVILIEELRTNISRLTNELTDSQATISALHQETEQLKQVHQYAIANLEQQLHEASTLTVARQEEVDSLVTQHEVSLQALRTELDQAQRDLADRNVSVEVQQSVSIQPNHSGTEASLEMGESSTSDQPQQQAGTSSGETPIVGATTDLFAENMILRQCVNNSVQMQDDMTNDVSKLLELKDELETAVGALKGEIWSLNGQLKASVIDRENLEERVAVLDSSLAAEKRRADGLDSDLAEQVELTEKATRQAAEAENESNRRLAECLDMETRREELEKSYVQLTEYYNQLQAAYNVLYAKVNTPEPEEVVSQETNALQSSSFDGEERVMEIVVSIMEELHIAVDETTDLSARLALIHETMKMRLQEVEDSRRAISEQRTVNEALSSRLEVLETEVGRSEAAGVSAENQLTLLRGDLEWKEEECTSLQRKLQSTVEALIVRNEESEAAKLATRQADVDALFRTNAELAHTNVRLQNELDEKNDGNEEREQQESEKAVSDAQEVEDQLNQHISDLEQELSRRETRIQEIEKELADTKTDFYLCTQKLEAALAEKNELQQELSTVLEQKTIEAAAVVTASETRPVEETLPPNEVEFESDQVQQGAEPEEETSWGWGDEEEAVRNETDEMNDNMEALKLLFESTRLENDDLRTQLQVLETQFEQAESGAADEIGEITDGLLQEMRSQLVQALEHNQELEKQLEQHKSAEVAVQKEHRDKCEATAEELLELRLERDDLLQQLNSVKEEAAEATRLRQLVDELNTRIEQLEKELELAKETTDAWGEDWNEEQPETESGATQELEQLRETEVRLTAELNEKTELLSSLQAELERHKNQEDASPLEAQLATGTSDAWSEEWNEDQPETEGGATEELEQLRETEVRLTAQLNQKTELLSSLQAELEQYEKLSITELTELRLERDDLLLQLDSVKEEAAEATRLRQLVDELNARIEQLEKELELAKETTDAWGEDWNDEQPETESGATQELEQLRETEVRLTAELNGKTEQLSSLQAEFEQHMNQDQQEVSSLKAELESLTAELERTRGELDELRSSAEEKEEAWGWEEQSSQNQMDSTREDIQRVREELDSSESEVRRLTDELFTSSRKVEELVVEIEKLESERSCWFDKEQDFNAELLAVRTDLEEKVAEIANVRSLLSVAEASIASSKQEQLLLQKSTDEVDSIKKTLLETQKQNELLKESEGRLLESVDEYGRLADRNTEEAARLQTVVNRLESERQDVEELRNSLSISEEQVASLQAQLTELRQKAESSHDSKKNTGVNLEAQLKQVSEERDQLLHNLHEARARLAKLEEEKRVLRTSYDQLRARVRARGQAAAASAPAPTMPAADAHYVPEEPREPTPSVMVPLQHAATPTTDFIQRYRGEVDILLSDIERYLLVEEISDPTQNHLTDTNMGKRKSNRRAPVVHAAPTVSQTVVEEEKEDTNIISAPKLELQLQQSSASVVAPPSSDTIAQEELPVHEDIKENLYETEPIAADILLQFDETKQLLASAEDELKVSREREKELINELSEFRTKMDAVSDVNSSLSKQHEAEKEVLRLQIEALTAKLGTENELNDSLVKRLEEEQTSKSSLMEEISQLQASIEVLHGEHSENLTKVKEYYSSLQAALEEELSSSRDSVEHFKTLLSAEEDRRTDMEKSFKNALGEAIANTAEIRSEFEAATAKLVDAHNDSEVILVNECDEVKKELVKLKEEHDISLNQSRQHATDLQCELDNARQELSEHIHRLEVEIREKEQTNSSLLQATNTSPKNSEVVNQLREDNLRLETEMLAVQEKLESANLELQDVRSQALSSEEAALKSRNEAQSLFAQLERARFDLEQLINSTEGVDASNRVRELERTISELKTKHSETLNEVLEDLRTSDLQLKMSEETVRSTRLENEDLARKMESWRSRFETASQELEHVGRCVEEVAHLESALQKAHSENHQLAGDLSDCQEEVRRLQEEQKSMSGQLETVSQQLQRTTEKLQQAGDSKTQSTLSFVELESQLRTVTNERDELLRSAPLVPNEEGMGAAMVDVTLDRKDTQLSIDEPEALTIESDDQVSAGDVHDAASQDFNASTSRLLRASAPTSTPWDTFSRRLRALRRRPRRAILPLFRLAFVVYFVVIHFLLFRCSF